MTDIAFHFGAVDKVAYASRLLRKATAAGARVLVLAPAGVGSALDSALWSVSPLDFVSHCTFDATPAMQMRSAVLIAQHTPVQDDLPGVCVNLGQPVPEAVERFARVIEVVSTDDADRAGARERWKQYTAQGFTIVRHDLALQGPGA